MKIIQTYSFVKLSADRVEHPPIHPYKGDLTTNLFRNDVSDEEKVKEIWEKKKKRIPEFVDKDRLIPR